MLDNNKIGNTIGLNICLCEEPIKEYSKSGCVGCWSCKKCNKLGGCDNRYWDANAKKPDK